MCTRILQTQLKLDQNVVENKLIKRDNLWIKPYIRFITDAIYICQKLEHVIVMITWSANATFGRKIISGINCIM